MSRAELPIRSLEKMMNYIRKKANRSAAGLTRDSIDLGPRHVDSMHPNPVHADLHDLGMEIPLRRRK